MDGRCNGNIMPSYLGRKDESRLYKNSVFHWIQKRKQSEMVIYPNKILKTFATRKLPPVFQAKDFNMGTTDKIFASHWLDERNVVYGTKCNKVSFALLVGIPFIKLCWNLAYNLIKEGYI